MFTSKIVTGVRACRTIARSQTTHRNSKESGLDVFNQTHTERLKYKYKDNFFDQDPIMKSDKEILQDFLQDGRSIRNPSDLEAMDKIVK